MQLDTKHVKNNALQYRVLEESAIENHPSLL